MAAIIQKDLENPPRLSNSSCPTGLLTGRLFVNMASLPTLCPLIFNTDLADQKRFKLDFHGSEADYFHRDFVICGNLSLICANLGLSLEIIRIIPIIGRLGVKVFKDLSTMMKVFRKTVNTLKWGNLRLGIMEIDTESTRKKNEKDVVKLHNISLFTRR